MPPSPSVVPTPDYSGWLVRHIPERPYQSSYSQDASFPSLFVPTSFKNNTHTLAKSSPKRFELFLELAQKKFKKGPTPVNMEVCFDFDKVGQFVEGPTKFNL